MGGSISSRPTIPTKDNKGRLIDEDHLVKILMPIYYTSDSITPYEQDKAVKAWKVIASGQAAEFYRMKKATPELVPCNTPMEFFGNRLVKRFIEVHPVVAHMFNKNSMKQGGLFFRMIAFVVSALDDDSKFDSQFVTLAKTHNKMGIRAVEYGIFGECLFWIFRLTLGVDIYDSVAHLGWVKIYSRMLRVIIPIVVRHEVENKDSVTEKDSKRFQAMLSSTADGVSVLTSTSRSSQQSDDHQHRNNSVVPASLRHAAVVNTAEAPVGDGHLPGEVSMLSVVPC